MNMQEGTKVLITLLCASFAMHLYLIYFAVCLFIVLDNRFEVKVRSGSESPQVILEWIPHPHLIQYFIFRKRSGEWLFRPVAKMDFPYFFDKEVGDEECTYFVFAAVRGLLGVRVSRMVEVARRQRVSCYAS